VHLIYRRSDEGAPGHHMPCSPSAKTNWSEGIDPCLWNSAHVYCCRRMRLLLRTIPAGSPGETWVSHCALREFEQVGKEAMRDQVHEQDEFLTWCSFAGVPFIRGTASSCRHLLRAACPGALDADGLDWP